MVLLATAIAASTSVPVDVPTAGVLPQSNPAPEVPERCGVVCRYQKSNGKTTIHMRNASEGYKFSFDAKDIPKLTEKLIEYYCFSGLDTVWGLQSSLNSTNFITCFRRRNNLPSLHLL